MKRDQSVLVTDFDGTITGKDFFRLAVERLLTPEDMAPWDAFLAGKTGHFAAVQMIFGKIRAPESAVLALLDDMQPDPRMPEYVRALHDAGWRVVVASAGCEWYIRIILERLGVSGLEIHANPGMYREGGPLEMSLPVGSPFYSPETGIDKEAIVRANMGGGPAGNVTVVYAGDGVTDVPAGLMLPPSRRFARSDMAESLRRRGEGFRPFNVWSDVAEAILKNTL